jgi:hypothetical protein
LIDIRADELPEFRAWSERFEPPADTSVYITQNIGITTAMVLSELFFPELTKVRDCILLLSHYEPSNFDKWWASTAGDRVAVERVINHVHLWDLFEPTDEPEKRALEVLSRRVAQAWRCYAEASFPDREFEVTVTDEYGPTVVMNSR